MSHERQIQLTEPVDFGADLGDLHFVTSAVAHDGALWILGLEGRPDQYIEHGGARFPKSVAGREQTHVAIRLDERGDVERHVLRAGRRNLHLVQPLPRGRVIAACARCYEDPDGSPERNAVIFGRDGSIEAELVLGDAVQDLQATSKGVLWASYFDEGTGMRGRGEVDPIGASGLVVFDDTGKTLLSFDPTLAGTDAIVDCYAMNVATSTEAWIYFYTEFSLVRLSLEGALVSGPPKSPARGQSRWAAVTCSSMVATTHTTATSSAASASARSSRSRHSGSLTKRGSPSGQRRTVEEHAYTSCAEHDGIARTLGGC